jgi:hypothetical protein
LRSEDFEAVFTEGENVVELLEGEDVPVAENTPPKGAKALEDFAGGNEGIVTSKGGLGAKGKRARKMKWQENVAKAREARRRKLEERRK